MKRFIILFCLLFATISSAVELDCSFSLFDQDSYSIHAVMVEKTKIDCVDYENDKYYNLKFTGIGPGLQLNIVKDFTVACTNEAPTGRYFTVKASAACGSVAGGECGVSVGLKGGCVIKGLVYPGGERDTFGFGLGASVGSLKLTRIL